MDKRNVSFIASYKTIQVCRELNGLSDLRYLGVGSRYPRLIMILLITKYEAKHHSHMPSIIPASKIISKSRPEWHRQRLILHENRL